jgi:NMD protein affecting ribosome stability and mRNA decay
MRPSPRVSNAPWKKRVDHVDKREPQPAVAEPVVCPGCGAIYVRRRWVKDLAPERQTRATRQWAPVRRAVCPACRQRAAGIASGVVEMSGSFLTTHRPEIMALLKHEAERAAADNPLGRIMKITRGRNATLTVTTTTERLAQRLGRALQRACKGRTRYSFSHENKLARVLWRRD